MIKNKIVNKDLFGNIIEENELLRDKFIEPPFSVLDGRGGSWQNRKKQWNSIGMQSEVGRDVSANPEFGGDLDENGLNKYGRKPMTGTSIFDPALTELIYRWFCPEGGTILDPFAGGSVRGIVANYLGFKYTGIDIREEQVNSNNEQAVAILEDDNQPNWITGDSNIVLDNMQIEFEVPDKVKVSAANLKQKFQTCEPEYIKNVCHGRCCEGSGGLKVTIHESEKERFSSLCELDGNFVKDVSGTGVCPFKKDDLCSIHEQKPFGCAASPFTLNANGTLIVRNRYRMLKCYNTEEAVPAYIAHRWSLEQIFGFKETEEIISKVKAGEDVIYANIAPDKYKMLVDNDAAKHPERLSPKYDLIFSCPPYADLEVYSDLPGDISNKEYDDFITIYETIIKKSCAYLKPGGYAVFVVGDIRDKKGNYRDFVSHTKQAFINAGLHLYNEAILLTPLGTAMLRAAKVFKAGKKLTKVHENVLIFKK